MNPERHRVRREACSIKNCPNMVRRANAYSLCVNHLVAVWEFVAEDVLPQELRKNLIFDLASAQPPPRHKLTFEESEARRLARNAVARKASATNGTLYVLDTRNELIKIGFTSRHIDDRMSQYPPNFRLIIDVPGTRADERDVHRSLAHARAAKREWYNVTPEVVRQINEWIALKNVLRAQTIAAHNEKYPNQPRKPQLLPKFTSVDEWDFSYGGTLGMPAPTRPAPKTRGR